MKKMSRKDLENLEIEVDTKGFTIWVSDKEGKSKGVRHWLVDASRVFIDAEIRINKPVNGYQFDSHIIYNPDAHTDKIVFMKTKNK